MVVLLTIAGYLIGSVPVAWIITKLVKGEDLRQLGSGNIGVMNVGLSVARWAGVLVFCQKLLKGLSLCIWLGSLQVINSLSALLC